MNDKRPARVPVRGVVAAVLLAIPFVGMLWVGTYAKLGPRLWGMPFFYWYQFLWVIIAAGCTAGAYLLVRRTGRAHGPDADGGPEKTDDATGEGPNR